MTEEKPAPKRGRKTDAQLIKELKDKLDDANQRVAIMENRLEASFVTLEDRMTEIEKAIERLAAGKSWWSDTKKRLGSR